MEERFDARRGLGLGTPGVLLEPLDGDLQWTISTIERLAELLRTAPYLEQLSEFLAERYAQLIGDNAAAVGLLRPRAEVVATSEAMAAVVLEDLERLDGPVSHVARSGTPSLGVELGPESRWPRFAHRARAAGYRSVEAVAMRSAAGFAGVVAIFHRSSRPLGAGASVLLQSIADLAAASLSTLADLRESEQRVLQLEHALSSRIRIEQAKGLLAERLGIDVATAFELVRQYSRNRNLPIDKVVDLLLGRELSARELISGAKRLRGRRGD